ncbi:MAG: AI-2E family transporter [Hyphomicrobium sp.]
MQRNLLFWLALAIAFLVALRLLSPVLLPFVAGLVIAYFLNPVVDRLSAAGLPRGVSTVLLLVLTTAALALAVFILAPPAIEQGRLLLEAMPAQAERLKAVLEDSARGYLGDRYPQAQESVSRAIAGLTDGLPALAGTIGQSLWSQGMAAFNFLSLMLVTPLVAFYALLDWPKILAKVDSWLPRSNADQIRMLAREIDQRVSAFIRGQGVVCLVLAAFYSISLSLLGLRYGLLVGLLTGLFSFIPFAGWAMGLITATGLAVVQHWPEITPILTVVGVFLAGQALDASLLSPQIVGSKIGLHPVWLIFSLLVFSYLFGFLGLLVAVPVAAAIGVLVRFALDTYMRSSMYRGPDAPLA